MNIQVNPNCRLCPLWEGAKNVCIGGRGVDRPKFLFVGENPEQEEDEAGEVFVGSPGKLLIQAIKEYDFRPARVTNAVKCVTPGNREPFYSEAMACRQYLSAEIRAANPKFIVAVGGLALNVLTGKTGVAFWSGRLAGELRGIPVLALIHPAYVLRSGSYEAFNGDCISLKTVAGAIEMFKKSFPEAKISDAVGLTDGAIKAGEPEDPVERAHMQMLRRLRASMMAALPGILKKVRKEKAKEKKHESKSDAGS